MHYFQDSPHITTFCQGHGGSNSYSILKTLGVRQECTLGTMHTNSNILQPCLHVSFGETRKPGLTPHTNSPLGDQVKL